MANAIFYSDAFHMEQHKIVLQETNLYIQPKIILTIILLILNKH